MFLQLKDMVNRNLIMRLSEKTSCERMRLPPDRSLLSVLKAISVRRARCGQTLLSRRLRAVSTTAPKVRAKRRAAPGQLIPPKVLKPLIEMTSRWRGERLRRHAFGGLYQGRQARRGTNVRSHLITSEKALLASAFEAERRHLEDQSSHIRSPAYPVAGLRGKFGSKRYRERIVEHA